MPDTKLLELLPTAVFMTDAEGRLTFYNEAAAALWGRRPELLATKWCGSWRMHAADGKPLPPADSPVAVSLREGRAVRGIEIIVERADGVRVRVHPTVSPLRDEAGRLVGAFATLIDVSEQEQGLESARLAAIVSSSTDAIISKGLDGRVRSWNAGAMRIFGYTADEMIGHSITRIIPSDLHHQEAEILAKIQRGEHIEHYETVRVAKDGRRLEISLSVSPVRDRLGNIVGASKVARDITPRREAERLQHLLIQELNHRVKNMLATVQAIASQSLRYAKSPAEFASSFMERVQALSRVHNLLTTPSMMGAEIDEIVRLQVLLALEADLRVSTSGPPLLLQPKAATHLALILHELGTNARKYGALSDPRGHVAISWDIELGGGNSRALRLIWREGDGPPVEPPSARGFGTTLIEQTLRSRGGTVAFNYAPDGLVCEIVLPLVTEISVAFGDPPAAAEKQAAVRPALHAGGDKPLAGKRVLIVEDEAMVAMEIETTLLEAGCTVLGPVATVEQARMLIAGAGFDAALLDGNLGGRHVDELADLLVSVGVPFAFVTGYGRESLPSSYRDWPMLAKPFGPAQLRVFLGGLIRRGSESSSAPTARAGAMPRGPGG